MVVRLRVQFQPPPLPTSTDNSCKSATPDDKIPSPEGVFSSPEVSSTPLSLTSGATSRRKTPPESRRISDDGFACLGNDQTGQGAVLRPHADVGVLRLLPDVGVPDQLLGLQDRRTGSDQPGDLAVTTGGMEVGQALVFLEREENAVADGPRPFVLVRFHRRPPRLSPLRDSRSEEHTSE